MKNLEQHNTVMDTVGSIDRFIKQDRALLTIHVCDSAATAARKMSEEMVGSLIVLDSNDDLVGIVSERDVLAKVTTVCRDPRTISVGDIMSDKVITCDVKTSVNHAQELMATHRIRHLPLTDEDIPVGMVSARDIMAHQLFVAHQEVRKQREWLTELEKKHPGITKLDVDCTGRVIL